ncbi:hypothetical protein P3T76_001303 [Phytophthora citrophthora]|uniref:Uncharacterized protein n=1 Tax=Phytophthora citrophthora TaxID=4793 RepID=A0AAD9GZU6_9STRA|nr:hypothetical protein P3T76_001303 [Phytophthora citrophthora]
MNSKICWNEGGDTNVVIATLLPGLDANAHEQRRKTIYQWRKHQTVIQASCNTVKGQIKKKSRSLGTGTALHVDAETELGGLSNAGEGTQRCAELDGTCTKKKQKKG